MRGSFRIKLLQNKTHINNHWRSEINRSCKATTLKVLFLLRSIHGESGSSTEVLKNEEIEGGVSETLQHEVQNKERV